MALYEPIRDTKKAPADLYQPGHYNGLVSWPWTFRRLGFLVSL